MTKLSVSLIFELDGYDHEMFESRHSERMQPLLAGVHRYISVKLRIYHLHGFRVSYLVSTYSHKRDTSKLRANTMVDKSIEIDNINNNYQQTQAPVLVRIHQ